MTSLPMYRALVGCIGGIGILAVDTIAHVRAEDEGSIVITGSHGGISSGEYAARVPLAAVFFNDAGIGKEEAGIAALPYLATFGIVAGAVSHASAQIGDARETWGGEISALNQPAEAAGFTLGAPLQRAVQHVFGGRGA